MEDFTAGEIRRFRKEFHEKYQTGKDKKSEFKPRLIFNDNDWKRAYGKFKEQLKKDTVLDVIENNLLPEHQLYLLPPPQDDEVLKTQLENARLYDESLAEGGRFFGAYNNLATKLTLLYFGHPIAPITLNNINNSDKDDQNDESDPPESPPRIQRILYAEKPLEFLNKYNERSYGYPILRSR